MRIQLLLIYSFLLLFRLEAQTYERLSIDFSIDGKVLQNPLVGGINTPQLSSVDFNEDGAEDLYIFDRSANVHLAFLHDGVSGSTNYTFAPEYTENFPLIEHFVLLRDYDQDGAQDIFAFSDTPGISGITVYKGFYENGKLAFERYPFPSQNDFPVLYFPLESGTRIPLYVALNDYPAVDDVDGDGDLDILTFNAAGGFLEYFPNQSMERGYGTDSLIYILEDRCWGGFYESGLTPAIDLSERKGRCFDTNQVIESRHAGSTVLSLDLDENCGKELLLGDLSFDNLIFVNNEGDCEEAWATDQDINFPNYDTPAKVALFPASFHLDIDRDGAKDLVVTPNNEDNTTDYFNMWWYKNTNTDASPIFELQNQSFLTEETLDFGSGSHPTFVDYNDDGLMDIVVGTVGYFEDAGNRDPRLILIKNIGTATAPVYEVEDDNFLNFRQFKEQSWNFSPAFGDLDSDGDLDLLVGEETGSIFFVENTSSSTTQFRTDFIQPNYMSIDIGASSTPHLVDINQDGLLDLLVGERNGNVNYFQNVGTAKEAFFQSDQTLAPNTQIFGRIDAREPGFVTGLSSPVAVNTTQGLKIVTGTAKGQIELYDFYGADLNETFELLQAPMGNIKEGSRSHASFSDINRDGKLEVVVGNYRGGLAMYGTDLESDTNVSNQDFIKEIKDFVLFPNPAKDQINWQTNAVFDQIQVYSVLGQIVLNIERSNNISQLDISTLSAGVYYFSFMQAGAIVATEKLIKK
ncbi:MAG: T9SS type A sorting domain-containing protein [Bacteroidota bacterium]